MKLISLFILLGCVLVTLTLKKDDLLIGHKRTVTDRKIASGNSNKCMRDLFTVEALKEEVKELEANLDTNRISGTWKHLDLTTLPTSAADFLKKHGDKLAVGETNCMDVPCLYNEIYETPEGIAGYVHYLWYLRTGSYLAADNIVPNQVSQTPGIFNGKSLPLSSYLFDEDELYGFWRLSKMLRVPHSALTFLKEVQRIPRGEKMEGANAVACGLAHSDGWITLSDQCLTVYRQSDSGYFFPAVLHEMSHQVDFEDGKRYNDGLYRSQRDDFLNLSGFQLREYRNSSGQLIRQWLLSPGAKLVTAYARNSPQENFAELLAYYRMEADTSKAKVNSSSWDFASDYYEGKNFSYDAIASDWIKDAAIRNTRDILKASLTCDTDICLNEAMDLLAREEIGRIRSEEADGCRVLNNPVIGQTLPERLATAFRKISDDSQVSRDAKENILSGFDDYMNPEAAYESFFSCHATGADCYEEKIKEKKNDFLLPVYLNIYSFEKITEEVSAFYGSLLLSREGVMKLKADELWESCQKIPVSDKLPPAGSDFLVKDGYMVSSFYNCVNRGFNSALEASLNAVKLKEFSPKNPEERAFILSLMRPAFTEILEDHLRSAREYELKYRDAFVEQQGTWLAGAMRSNRWWMPRGRPDQATLEAACRNAAVDLIGGEIYFHLKKDLYQVLLENTCKGIK
jgi:hypothetical protein